MSKKRTRKQKQKARHQFLKPSQKKLKKGQLEAGVKRQKDKPISASSKKTLPKKLPSNSDNLIVSASIKHDLIKSLIVSGLIITAEVMLYLAWK